MTTRHTGQARRSNVASRVATTVRDALKSEPRLKRSAVALSARIAGTAAAAVADLPEEARATLTRREPELITRIRGLVEAFGETARPAHIALDFGREVEPRKGAGVGTVVSEAEGDAALHELAVARRLEDWAGEVAGASALLRDYGIARSSLHRWQQNGDVIALLKGAKKHVFPVDQFIDSRPAKGISGHLDHAGGAAELKEKLGGVPIEGPHIADKTLLDNLEGGGARFGITGMRNVAPDRWLDEGDSVQVGHLTFEIFHCPGHSPGSVVFFNKDMRFAHVGDVLFNGSVGRTDLPGGSHATLINSIKTKLLPLGDDVGFICGHGPGSSIGQERQTNPFIVGE